LVIWFGFGSPTVRVSAFIVSFFPILANSLLGLGQSDEGLRELFKSLGANQKQSLFYLQIPASLPHVFSGLQIAAGLAVIGAIVGEFVAGGGLGGLIDSARTQQRVDVVFAALFLSSLLGVLFIAIIKGLMKALLFRRPYFDRNSI
jgi:NitT/TauT family transport system permease protein